MGVCLSRLGIAQPLELYAGPDISARRLVPVLENWAEEKFPLRAYLPTRRDASTKVRAFVALPRRVAREAELRWKGEECGSAPDALSPSARPGEVPHDQLRYPRCVLASGEVPNTVQDDAVVAPGEEAVISRSLARRVAEIGATLDQ